MIDARYLLVLNVPLWRDGGRYWADQLWHKDLEAHRTGAADLAIACPVIATPPPPGALPISDIRVHPLPPMRRTAVLAVPVIVARLWRAIGEARIVHTGVVGWPFPLGWLAIPIARLRRRFVVLVVESATWRVTPGVAAPRFATARAAICERIARHAVAASDLSFFTIDAYRRELGGGARGQVLPAIWIDDDRLIDARRLGDRSGRRDRLLFSGRLTAAKGVAVLLEAIGASGVAVDFIGEGELAETVRDAARRHLDLVRLLDPVAYGAAFDALLDEYAALVVPTLSDEQPRVIFDAFARGLAVLASDTAGNRQVVADGENGRLFVAGDRAALVDTLRWARAQPDRLAAMGAAARQAVAGRTHAVMHATRFAAIERALTQHRPT